MTTRKPMPFCSVWPLSSFSVGVQWESMPNKLRNSRSWFCRTRRSNGFRTVAGLAQKLGVPKGTVHQWECGSAHRPPSYRPPWKHILNLRDALGVELKELVKRLWGEKVGDPCPCGCGGRKTFPTSQTTHKLLIKLPCAKCGTERIYPQGKRDRHRKLCLTCGKSVERIEFTCVGYQDHNATRYARTCPRTIKLRPCDVSSRQWWKRRLVNSAFDVSSRTYQCNGCAGAERLHSAEEKVLKVLEVRKHPGKNIEKIRTRQQRLELRRVHHREFSPNFKASREAQELGRRRFIQNAAAGKKYPKKTIANLKRHWGGDNLPKRICLGICIVCGKFIPTMNSRDPHFHKACHQEWERTPEGRHYQSLKIRGKEASLVARKRKPGRPVDTDVFVPYLWTVQYCAGGKSFRQIAKENKVDHTTVRDRVSWLLSRTPDPSLVAARFRPTMRLFLAAYRALQLGRNPSHNVTTPKLTAPTNSSS